MHSSAPLEIYNDNYQQINIKNMQQENKRPLEMQNQGDKIDFKKFSN